MKAKITIAALFLCLVSQGLLAQPLVYNTENSGAGCAPPPLPSFSQLPVIEPLPDPFLWANGSGRSTSFSDWECHRNEFKRQIENYEIGIKPPRPDSITASYTPTSATAGTLTVVVKRNGQTLTLTSAVALPAVAGPWPAIIGMNSATGSVPATVFTSRNIARITYNHNNVTTYGSPSLNDPFYKLYPEYNLVNAGQYSAWAWGVSRIIDGLELVQASLPIKLDKIGVTGCSYAGKMALFSGAFDERVALTIAQESGGGGAPAWRVSETLGAVEKLGATDYNWFRDSMRLFAGANVPKLPHDHHELMAMVAPRALLVTGNLSFEWLANPASYVSARAAKSIYSTLGISDRFGFYIDGDHNHCAVPTAQVPAMQAFVDKFLADIPNVNTDTITINPYPNVNYQRWYQWWGTGSPILPPLPPDPPVPGIYMEAECATVGSNWSKLTDTAASNGTYVVVNGLNSTTTAPTGANAAVVFTFNIDSAGAYNFTTRINCPTGDDDSYWIKVDNGTFATVNNLGTAGWQWVKLTSATLSVGMHTFTMAYREDGAKLDKLVVTTSSANIPGKGLTATNCSTVCNTALGNRLYVDTAAAGGGNGAAWGCAFKQLYDATEYANTHPEISEIWIAKGMYKPRNNGNRSENFGLNRYGIRVVGGFSGTETMESQANSVANPTILSGDVGVQGSNSDNSMHLFILYKPAYGGALAFKNLTMQDTRAGDVGGVAYIAYLSNISFDSCTFKNNYAPTGGAFYIDNTSVVYNNCSFDSNLATVGGGIYSFQASPVLNKCMFRNNTGSAGGAYYGNYGQPVFRDVVFTKNTSVGDGGAVYQNTMSADYMNCVLDSNMAQGVGGAIFVHNSGRAGLLNSTLHGNWATNSGGAIFADYNGASVTALNTIFWGNSRNGNMATPGNDVDAYDFTASVFRNTMMQQSSKVPADNGTTRINNMWGVLPGFMKESNTMGADMMWRTSDDGLQLMCMGAGTSVVVPNVCGAGINSGDNSLAIANDLTMDIMGNPRIVCTTIDRGAYELQSCNSQSTYVDEAKTVGKSLLAITLETENAAIVANPFSTQLRVRYVGNNIASISVTSATGKMMAQQNNLSSGMHSFDATTWGRGLYNVVLISDTGKKMVMKAIRL